VLVQVIIVHEDVFHYADLNDEILMNNRDNLLVVFLRQVIQHDVLLIQHDEYHLKQLSLHDVYERVHEEKDIYKKKK
jgi:hypothetical protein